MGQDYVFEVMHLALEAEENAEVVFKEGTNSDSNRNSWCRSDRCGSYGRIRIVPGPMQSRGDMRYVPGESGGTRRIRKLDAKVFPSIDAMLADGNIDAVSVCLPRASMPKLR